MTVVLLGPQRRPSLDRLVTSLGLTGPFATISSGWQEREKDDSELDRHLGGSSRNLHLWHRMQDVFECDPQYAAAHRDRRAQLLELQELYQLGLSHTVQFLDELRSRTAGSTIIRGLALDDAVQVLRGMDKQHIARVGEINAQFYAQYPPHERPAIARHRREVSDILAESQALVLTGGHIVELIDSLHLFNVNAAGMTRMPIIAWSAGAMALTSQVVLFDEYAVRGPGCSEVFDLGLGVLPGIVALPSAKQRLRTDDKVNMGLLAKRFEPNVCLPLDPGARVQIETEGELPSDATVLDTAGNLRPYGETITEADAAQRGGDDGEACDQPTA